MVSKLLINKNQINTLTSKKEYPFEQAIEALEKTEARHARGKLVVKGLK